MNTTKFNLHYKKTKGQIHVISLNGTLWASSLAHTYGTGNILKEA